MGDAISRPVRNHRPGQRRGTGSGGRGSNEGGRRYNGGGRRNSGENNGNASSARNKYLDKAKEALSSGDRVAAESYFQHADHYNRILVAAGEKRASADNSEKNDGENTTNESSN